VEPLFILSDVVVALVVGGTTINSLGKDAPNVGDFPLDFADFAVPMLHLVDHLIK
jgi:hypothetical protein